MVWLCPSAQVELVPNGAMLAVRFQERHQYAEAALRFRATEADAQVEAIRRGLGKIVPLYLLALYTGEEMETMVCGLPYISIPLLKNTCQYDGPAPTSTHVKWFWEVHNQQKRSRSSSSTLLCWFDTPHQVLENEFTHAEQVAFLRFVSGRSRLPTNPAMLRPTNCHLKLSNMSARYGRCTRSCCLQWNAS